MSYITGLTSIEKGQRGELSFDKSQFIFATSFASDPYFEDELNWKRIALHYKIPTGVPVEKEDFSPAGGFNPWEIRDTLYPAVWFLADTSHNLPRVDFYLRNNQVATGEITATLYEGVLQGSNYVPTGSAIAVNSNMVLAESINTTGEYVPFFFNNPNLNLGTHYVVVLSSASTSGNAPELNANTSQSTGSDFGFAFSGDMGSSWNTGSTLYPQFKIYEGLNGDVTKIGQQRQIVILKDDGSRGWYAPSETCRTGNWEIEKIEIYDKQGDRFEVDRVNMPSPENFDIDVQRKVPPASLVSAVVEEAELVNNGTFDSDLSGWTDLGSGASHNAAGHANYAYSGDLGLSQVLATVPTFRYKFEWRQVDVQGLPSLVLNASFRESTADTGTFSGVAPNRVETATDDSFNGQTLSAEVVAANASSLIVLGSNGNASGTVQFDDVSFKAVPNKLDLDSGEGENWRVGFKCRIWDDIAGSYLTNDVYEITDITGDQITLDQQIIGDYEGKTLRLRFPEYQDASGVQASLYQYVSQGF